MTTDCSLLWHSATQNVIVHNTEGSALYSLIVRIAVGRSPAKAKLHQILNETASLPGIPLQFGGAIGKFHGDTGFASEFKDDYLYSSQWGTKQPASRQTGHFLTAVAMGMTSDKSLRRFYLRSIVGHELRSDGKGVSQLFSTFNQILAPSQNDVDAFEKAVATDIGGNYRARDSQLFSIFDPDKHGDQASRVGNSMEDLRLSVRGWRLGTAVSQGVLQTNKDVATWIALNVAGE